MCEISSPRTLLILVSGNIIRGTMAEGVWTVIVDVNVATFSDSFTITHSQETTTVPAPVITIFSQNSEFRSLFSAWTVRTRKSG